MAITWTTLRADRRSARETPARRIRSLCSSGRLPVRAARWSATLALAVSAAHAQVVPPPPPPSVETQAPAQTAEQLSRRQTQSQQRPLTFVPTISLEETITDNVNLQPSATRRSDLVTQIIPGVAITERGARTRLEGNISAPILLYARTGADNNRVVPQVNLLGNVEAVERLFFVEASIYVTQEYLSPFGTRSTSLTNKTDNQYVSQVYRVSPYFRGDAAADLHYEVRDNNIWSNLSSTPISVNNSYTNEVVAHLTRDALPFGWSLEYNRSDVKFTGQQSEVTELGRGRLVYRPDTRLELSTGAGYEQNRYPLAHFNDFIYSVGARWRPTERTTVDGSWEHRFFGSSYSFVFDHRTPLTVWNVGASRNVTSYPQLLAQFGPGSIVPLLLDALFASRIPDPAQRAQFVLQFIQDRGLPFVLSGPFNLYTQQIYLQERANATVGFIGARNSVFLTAYRVRTEPIAGTSAALPPLFELINNNTQVGGGVVWTYNITGSTTLSTSADYLHTKANAPLTGTTKQGSVRTVLTTPISANTSVYAGARFQSLHSDFSDSTREIAGYAGVTHTFR